MCPEAHGRAIIHLKIGQPEYDTYHKMQSARIKAIVDGQTRYNQPTGLAGQQAANAEQAQHQHELHFDLEQVVISPGATSNLFFPTPAWIEPGIIIF